MRRAALAVIACASLAGGSGLSCAKDVAGPTFPADGPNQYITVRRAWRTGERDSLIQFIVATGAWMEFSDLAPQAVPTWDSAVDVIVNPAWHDSAVATPPGLQMAPEYAAGWSTVGFDIRIVYDSVPGGAVQKDSLDWVEIFWYNPSENGWKGYLIDATTATNFGYTVVNTTSFNSTSGQTGSAAGEARIRADSATYWEGNAGYWRVTSTGSYGALSTIGSGVYKGGNIQTGLLTGNTASWSTVKMPRISGTTAPATQSLNVTWTNIPVQRIFCYFTPVPVPSGYTSCTGTAAAQAIALARAGRPLAAFTSGVR